MGFVAEEVAVEVEHKRSKREIADLGFIIVEMR